MSNNLNEYFSWFDFEGQQDETLTAIEKYKGIVNWSVYARGKNPNAFDAITEWILDDSKWNSESIVDNQRMLMTDIITRFKEQNSQLRTYLLSLVPTGVVNEAVFKALDHFDDMLSAKVYDSGIEEAVSLMFNDFSTMLKRNNRVQIAGNKTGPAGTDFVEIFGYMNYLKDCDAGVQWTLFMPDVVRNQQNSFKLDSFEYIKMPSIRFIGCDADNLTDFEARRELFSTLDNLSEFNSDFTYDALFMHHSGLNVDVGPFQAVWGRFMQAHTPVPEGYIYFDFVTQNDGQIGVPYISQFAFAKYSGDIGAMHRPEGFDVNGMYDVTRNTMLGQGSLIPYPNKYWTAEVFLDGFDKPGTAYLFSSDLE